MTEFSNSISSWSSYNKSWRGNAIMKFITKSALLLFVVTLIHIIINIHYQYQFLHRKRRFKQFLSGIWKITVLLKCSSLVVEFLTRKDNFCWFPTITHVVIVSPLQTASVTKTTHNQHHSSAANTITALYASSELSQTLISDILTMRKEAFSWIRFEEIKCLWRICSKFSSEIEELVLYG